MYLKLLSLITPEKNVSMIVFAFYNPFTLKVQAIVKTLSQNEYSNPTEYNH